MEGTLSLQSSTGLFFQANDQSHSTEFSQKALQPRGPAACLLLCHTGSHLTQLCSLQRHLFLYQL